MAVTRLPRATAASRVLRSNATSITVAVATRFARACAIAGEAVTTISPTTIAAIFERVIPDSWGRGSTSGVTSCKGSFDTTGLEYVIYCHSIT